MSIDAYNIHYFAYIYNNNLLWLPLQNKINIIFTQ